MAHVVLVHTGPRFPEHINDCIEQVRRYNHTVSVIVSRNESNRVLGASHTYIAEDLEDQMYRRFTDTHSLDRTTMGGFWERTSSRFFLIHSLAEKYALQNIIHIENDVLLFSDMSRELDVLKDNCDVGLVIDSTNRCIPSLLFFRNAAALGKLGEHILKNATKTDMVSLAALFRENPGITMNLPIVPDVFDCFSTSQINYSNRFDQFNTVFDGAAIGQYLGGIDPIHGKSNTVGFVNETTVFDVSKFSFEWYAGEPYWRTGRDRVKICNLHVHSKNLRRFM